MPATGTRRGHLIYHWRHGWIPLDHFAALSKAKGSHKGAAKLMEKHGISAPRGGHDPAKIDAARKAGAERDQLRKELNAKYAGQGAPYMRQRHGIDPAVMSTTDLAKYHKSLQAEHEMVLLSDGKKLRDAMAAEHAKRHAASEKSLHPNLVKDLRGGSADKHLVTDATGTHFSAERAALHDKIIGQIVGGHKSHDKPAFVMLGGGPASGKTKAAEAAAHDFPGAVTINPDDIKAMLPEYKQLGPDKAAAFTHEESSYLAKQAMAAAIAQRSHVILDAVGDNSVKSVEGKVASAHAAGYSTHARYVTVPTDVAQARAVSRGIRSGRVVPPTVIAHAHAGVSDVFPQVMGKFDTASLHDNTTNWKPVLTTARGQAPTIHDPAAYRAFLRKAKAKG